VVVDLENYKSGNATRTATSSLQDAARGTRAFRVRFRACMRLRRAATMGGSSGFFVMRYETQM
jgi:hypothetical protein